MIQFELKSLQKISTIQELRGKTNIEITERKARLNVQFSESVYRISAFLWR